MSLFNVLRLYSSILVPVCSDWISAVDLCKLDTAVCNAGLRKHLLDTMSKCCLLHYEEEDLMEWIAMRGMGVRKLTMNSAVSEIHKQVLVRSTHLNELVINKDGVLSEVLDLCPVVLALVINQSADDEFLEVVSRLSCVRSLRTYFSGLTSSINEAIATNIPELREVNVKKEAAALIEGCKLLEVVEFPFTEEAMNAVVGLHNLRSLIFTYGNGIPLTDSDVMILLRNCSKLEKFALSESQLTDSFTASLARSCPRLTYFETGESLMTDETLIALAQCCPQLSVLKIRSESVTDTGVMAVLQSCVQMSSLSMDECHRLTDKSVQYALRSCGKLTYLSACGIDKLTDAAICGSLTAYSLLKTLQVYSWQLSWLTSKSVVSNCVDLQSIAFSGDLYYLCHTNNDPITFSIVVRFSAPDYRAIFMQCPRLQRISISRDDFTEECVNALLQYCPLLTAISFSHCSVPFTVLRDVLKAYSKLESLTYSGITKDPTAVCVQGVFSCRMKCLKTIHLQHCPIDDHCLDDLGAFCPSLQSIELRHMYSVTGSGVSRLLSNCVLIVKLVLLNCPKVGIEVPRTVVELRRKMKVLSFRNCTMESKELEELRSCLSELVTKFTISMDAFYYD